MKKSLLFPAMIALVVCLASCRQEQPVRSLFNGNNLSNWETFIGTPLNGFDSLALAATPEKVFSVVDDNGTKLIRISGEVNGSLATREEFSNYHLTLVFKWGETVYTTRNSGLLYHSFGDFGAAFGTWMTNTECQLMHGNLGDTYLMNNMVCETSAVKNDSTGSYTFSPGAAVVPFGETANGHGIKKLLDAEKPLGEWNTVELYSVGQTTVHVVNGITVMVNTKTGALENGIIRPVTSGKIQLQSEGGELFVKSIDIVSITKIPDTVMPKR